MVRPPSVAQEDQRRLSRERRVLMVERTQHINRIKGLLFSHGIADYEPMHRDRRDRIDELRTGDGRVLAAHMRAQINRELERLELVMAQIKTLEAERDAVLAAEAPDRPMAMLASIKGVGASLPRS